MSLRRLSLADVYTSDDDPLHSFYIPALRSSVRYERAAGYFRATSLAAAAAGLEPFLKHGGTMRLLCGVDLDPADVAAILEAPTTPRLAELLGSNLDAASIADDERGALGWMVATRRLEIRVALPRKGRPDGYFHLKLGLLTDRDGNRLAFQGSVNETGAGWERNCEGLDVHTSWATPDRVEAWSDRFKRFWNGTDEWASYDLPEAVVQEIVNWAAGTARPLWADVPPVMGALTAGTAPLVSPVQKVVLQPHQVQVVERLCWDRRSWIVADEVGLGKTISAGEALRRVLAANPEGRALVLAPANVTAQWVDELAGKVGITAVRLVKDNLVELPSSEQVESANPLQDNRWPLVVASSHLLRRDAWRERVQQSGPWDVLVVDEAHHARSRDKDYSKRDYNKLLQLLRSVRSHHPDQRMWLLTATPMQTTPNELYDLMWVCGMRDVAIEKFLQYYRTLASPTAEEEHLLELLPVAEQVLRVRHQRTPADEAAVRRAAAASNLDTVKSSRLLRSSARHQWTTSLPSSTLREWLKTAGPVKQYVTRHTRRTLLRYQHQGLLNQSIAARAVKSVSIQLTSREQSIYDELDTFISRLWEAERESAKGIGFVLAVYRRRLTSSWTAIERTLERLLDARNPLLEQEDVESFDGEEDYENLARSVARAEIAVMLRKVTASRKGDDSKAGQLRQDLARLRADGRRVIVFSQFADTVEHLRDLLAGQFGARVAIFTGAGVEMHEGGSWRSASKTELMAAADGGRVEVLLATDAASEGINLQMFSAVVNFDMPWNPARVEQRIGRVDRLGQRSATVEVLNYFVAGTIEEQVYKALERRVGDWDSFVGKYQPILGLVEEVIAQAAQLSGPDRSASLAAGEQMITAKQAEADESGLHLDDEDDWPTTA